MKMKITGENNNVNSSRTIRGRLNSGRATRRHPLAGTTAVNSSRESMRPARRPMLNSSTRRPVSRRTIAERPALNSSVGRPSLRTGMRRPNRPALNSSVTRRPMSTPRFTRVTERPMLNSSVRGMRRPVIGSAVLNSSVRPHFRKVMERPTLNSSRNARFRRAIGAGRNYSLNSGLRSYRKLNCSEDEELEEVTDVTEVTEAPVEDEITVTDLLIVQNPESKELSLFVPDTPEESVPEEVEVIATVEPATEEDLNSSCGGKKKLNSSEEDGAEVELDEEKPADGEETESTETVELPDGETVEVEDIFVVQSEDGEYDLFIAEEGAELPEEVEVVGEAVAADEDAILNSSRQVKKARARLNSARRGRKAVKRSMKKATK